MLDEYIRQIPSNQETELCETFQKPLPHASFHPSLSIITIIFIFISNNYLVCKKWFFSPQSLSLDTVVAHFKKSDIF